MKSVRNILGLAVVGASLSAAGVARANVVGLTNGDFEAQGLASGAVVQSVNDWYESSTAADYNDWLWHNNTAQMVTTSTVFGMSKTVGYIYQQIGTYTPGETVAVSGDAYKRSITNFRSVTVGLYAGNFTGADGTPLVATLLDSTTLTAAGLGFSGSPSHAGFSFTLDEGSSGVAGQPLWIRIAATAEGSESFLDNLSVAAVAVPTPAALPAGLSLLGLAAFSARRRSA